MKLKPTNRLNVRWLLTAILLMIVFLLSLRLGALYLDYAAPIALCGVLIGLLLLVSYDNYQS